MSTNLPEGANEREVAAADVEDLWRECALCDFGGLTAVTTERISASTFIERWECPTGHGHEDEFDTRDLVED